MQRARLKVLAHYSGGTMRCVCCGEDKLPFLALDHVGGGGATHRKDIGSGDQFYRWLIRSTSRRVCRCSVTTAIWRRAPTGPARIPARRQRQNSIDSGQLS